MAVNMQAQGPLVFRPHFINKNSFLISDKNQGSIMCRRIVILISLNALFIFLSWSKPGRVSSIKQLKQSSQ